MADGTFPQMASTHYPLPHVFQHHSLALAQPYTLSFSYPGIWAKPGGHCDQQNTVPVLGTALDDLEACVSCLLKPMSSSKRREATRRDPLVPDV